MSEPFDINEQERTESERKSEFQLSASDLWQKLAALWNAIWAQSLVVRRRGDTVMQLPLAVAIALAVFFPYAAVLFLVIALVAGYSITVVSK